jgi:hypothetical protein
MMATSQNGFPALTTGSNYIHNWKVPGTGRTFNLRSGSAGFLLAYVASWYNDNIRRIGLGIWDDWGWAFREIRDATDLSNHASGTAIDIDATKHPLGVAGTFLFTVLYKGRREIAKRVINRFLKNRMGGTVRWGENYSGRKDGMHFEIDAPLHEVERKARFLANTKRGKKILAANPGQRKIIFS